MINHLKYLLVSSAWLTHIGHGVSVYLTSDGTLTQMLAGLLWGCFRHFFGYLWAFWHWCCFALWWLPL